MIEKFLRSFPYLKPVNIHNLYNRLLKHSGNNLLLLYNKKKDTYELHSLRSFRYNQESLNAVIPDEILHGWLVTDVRANDNRKFSQEIQSERTLANETLDLYADRGMELLQHRALTTVEKMIGRDL